MGHEDSIISTFLALGLAVVFFIHFFKGLQSGKSILNDGVELFTYEPEVAPIVTATVQTQPPRQSSKPKRRKKTQRKRNPARPVTQPQKVQRNHNGYTELQQDCFDALKSLGIKAVRERQFIISNTFNKHDIKTVQDFLKVALHRGA